jgi:hypothetical protein
MIDDSLSTDNYRLQPTPEELLGLGVLLVFGTELEAMAGGV